ncbi:MAG: hypothetical protein WBB28_07430 [Crinalium sp.]
MTSDQYLEALRHRQRKRGISGNFHLLRVGDETIFQRSEVRKFDE